MKSLSLRVFLQIGVMFISAAVISVPVNAQTRPEGAPNVQTEIQSTKGLVLKKKAPVNPRLLEVTLPQPQEIKLKNGLRILLIEHHKVPTFTMRMVVMSGGLSDPPDRRGLAEFTANLLREGTKKRTSRQITEQLESVGATLNGLAGATSLMSFVNSGGQVQDLDKILDIFADVLLNPAFPADEIQKYLARTISIEELMRSDPNFLASQRFYRAIYGEDHPAGTVGPRIETLKTVKSAELSQFHATHYRPNNSVLIIAGDLTLPQLKPKLEQLFGSWAPVPIPKSVIPDTPAEARSHIHLVNRPDSVQTVLNLGNLGPPRVHPDYFRLLVMHQILGGPMGRLFLNLREDKGYTYGVGSFFTGSNFPGVWVGTTSVRTEVTEDALREFMNELKRIRDQRVTDAELDNAKRSIIGRFALSLELPDSQLQNVFTKEIFGLPEDYWLTYTKKVAAVTGEDIQAAARKYINLGNLQIVAVGNASKVEKALAPFGKITTYEVK